MNIIVKAIRIDGQTFFIPESPDAHFICRISGKPVISKRQYTEMRNYGFHVEII